MEEKNSGKKAKTTNLPAEAEVAEAAVPAAAAEVARLFTDDIILEILARLPARSVHRFKCVSSSWRDLIADPAHRKKLPHTIAGFLYSTTYNRENHFHFASVSAGAAPPHDLSLPFLSPADCLVDTCNGLLLCLTAARSSTSSIGGDKPEPNYIVCNPATRRRIDLPAHPKRTHRVMARLAFDPAFSSHFHVLHFEKADQGGYITGVNIYSSQTGAWNHRECQSVEKFCPYFSGTSVFFHGMLHLLSWLHRPMKVDEDVVLVAVDMEGQVRDTIRMPSGGMSFGRIGLSQGCLYYAATSSLDFSDNDNKEEDTCQDTKIAAVWYMKDYDSKQWVLKHTFSNDELRSIRAVEYKVAAIHPDCDTIFLDSWEADTLASYDMQRRKFHHILHLEKNKGYLFLPYVPLFSDLLADADGQ